MTEYDVINGKDGGVEFVFRSKADAQKAADEMNSNFEDERFFVSRKSRKAS